MKKLVMTPSQAQDFFQVTNQTLIRWSKQKRIETWRSPGNVRRYVWWIESDSEESSSEEEIAENEAQKAEIEAKIARYKKHLGKDTLLGRVAESSIPSLERELANLS